MNFQLLLHFLILLSLLLFCKLLPSESFHDPMSTIPNFLDGQVTEDLIEALSDVQSRFVFYFRIAFPGPHRLKR